MRSLIETDSSTFYVLLQDAEEWPRSIRYAVA